MIFKEALYDKIVFFFYLLLPKVIFNYKSKIRAPIPFRGDSGRVTHCSGYTFTIKASVTYTTIGNSFIETLFIIIIFY